MHWKGGRVRGYLSMVDFKWRRNEKLEKLWSILPPLWMKILGRMDFLRGKGFALL
jgi:hypothetical protein